MRQQSEFDPDDPPAPAETNTRTAIRPARGDLQSSDLCAITEIFRIPGPSILLRLREADFYLLGNELRSDPLRPADSGGQRIAQPGARDRPFVLHRRRREIHRCRGLSGRRPGEITQHHHLRLRCVVFSSGVSGVDLRHTWMLQMAVDDVAEAKRVALSIQVVGREIETREQRLDSPAASFGLAELFRRKKTDLSTRANRTDRIIVRQNI